MRIVPTDVHDIFVPVDGQEARTVFVHWFTVLLLRLLLLLRARQHAVYWTVWMWKLCRTNKFVLPISSKYTIVSILFCMYLTILALFTHKSPPYYLHYVPNSAQQVLHQCSTVRNKVRPSTSIYLQLWGVYRYGMVQRNIAHGRRTIRWVQ